MEKRAKQAANGRDAKPATVPSMGQGLSQRQDGGRDALSRDPRLRAGRRIPPKLYRIGEIVDYTGFSRQTIHNYTTMGLIRESDWTRGGHRLYDEDVFGRLDEIARLKAQHQTLETIREYFAARDAARMPATELELP